MDIIKLFPKSNNKNNIPDYIKMNIKKVVFKISLGVNPHSIHSKFFNLQELWVLSKKVNENNIK